MALALRLAGLRGLDTLRPRRPWTAPHGRNLLGAHVTIVGGGGIAESLLRLLAAVRLRRHRRAPHGRRPWRAPPRGRGRPARDALRRRARGAGAALTPETEGIIDRRRLDLPGRARWLVNVARGRHVVTDDLVAALRDGTPSAAPASTSPTPSRCPTAIRCGRCPTAIITPHVGNTPEMAVPLLSARITDNVRRWAAGEALVGLVDPDAGY